LAGNRLANINSKKAGGAAAGGDETEQNIHRGRFTGAIGTEKSKNFAGMDFEIKAGERHFDTLSHLAAAILHAQFFSF
jgi:hypothetical protein